MPTATEGHANMNIEQFFKDLNSSGKRINFDKITFRKARKKRLSKNEVGVTDDKSVCGGEVGVK